jgi:hypothetical protein
VAGLESGVASVSSGLRHRCALELSGSVRCWGHNLFGQLGPEVTEWCDFYTPCSTTPRAVDGVTDAVALEAGTTHTCVIVESGGVRCWGSNQFGQLGDGTALPRQGIVEVPGVEDAVALAAGDTWTCLLTGAGAVQCWGDTYGNTPVVVPGLESGVAAISARYLHACVVMEGGGVKCWGANALGQLGDGGRCGDSCDLPQDVPGLDGPVAAISAGPLHTCALLRSGGVKCWGSNMAGELGNGARGGHSGVPVDVVTAEIKPTPTPVPCPPDGCPTAPPAPPPPQTGLDFSISIDTDQDGIADCGTGARESTTCRLETGATFLVVGHLNALPPSLSTYMGFDFVLYYHGVASNQKSIVTWPDCGIPASYHDDTLAAFGCALQIGGAPSSFVGKLSTSEFTCAGPGSIVLAHGYGNTDLVRDVGQIYTEAPRGGEQLVINCGEPLAGDVDCSLAVSSVDAQLILQHHAKLLDWLGCPQHADVNIDRRTNSVDAALTVQYTAGLVASLPQVASRR